MSRAKELVRAAISQTLVRSGACLLGRTLLPSRGTVILYGHRLSAEEEGFLEGLDPSYFAAQLEYLARHYEIIPLAELVSCFEERRPVPERSVVLTFDDGFRDNLEYGLPVLQRLQAPATVFAVTGSMSSGELPWSQWLGFVFQHTQRECLQIDLVGPKPLELGSDSQRRSAYLEVKQRLKPLRRDDRERALQSIAVSAGVEPPRDRMLSWRDLGELRGHGIEVGAHTFSHPYLAEIPYDEAVWEMERSREDLREHFGIEHPPFCFPAGSSSPALVREVVRLGFRSVFLKTCPSRVNNLDKTHQFALRRLGLPNAPAHVLEAELDGPMHALRRVYRSATGADRRSANSG